MHNNTAFYFAARTKEYMYGKAETVTSNFTHIILTMKKLLSLLATATLLFSGVQAQYLTTAPDGGNKKAVVAERIGLTDITIHYDRPGVKGRAGKIWGNLAHYGYQDLGFGTSKAAPWRAGANENTTIEFSTDVQVEGKPLAAGKYGFFIAVGQESCTLIFSKNSDAWGSYFYTEAEDALRVTVQPVVMKDTVEWLKYEFIDQKTDAATVALLWETWKIPFRVKVDLHALQLASFRRELQGEKGFAWQSWNQAARYCLQNNINLEEALRWSDYAINAVFVGQANFSTLSTKASLLKKLGRQSEADSLMRKAMPLGTMDEVHNYARQLLAEQRKTEAIAAFKANAAKYPNQFTTLMGLARAYSAEGDFKNAIKNAEAALKQAPDKNTIDFLQQQISLLKKGVDINKN
jgi:tetratricopeptide (TPR) repeat protein